MKKHISVFMLMARSTIYQVILLLAVMALTETGLFLYALTSGQTDSRYGLELVLESCRTPWVFGGSFLLMSYLLCRTGTEGKTKTRYTLMRLSISEQWIFFWQSVYNTLCYLLLWMVQILTAMLLCRLYEGLAAPDHVTGQTVFLAFYRSDFLHSLLPFEDGFLWVRNIVLLLALGVCSARYPLGQRHGKKLEEITGMCIGTVFLFVSEIGDISAITVILMSLIGIGVAIFRALDKEVLYEEA